MTARHLDPPSVPPTPNPEGTVLPPVVPAPPPRPQGFSVRRPPELVISTAQRPGEFLQAMGQNPPDVRYDGERVFVTGGASFIGSHLVELLLSAGACVTVAD